MVGFLSAAVVGEKLNMSELLAGWHEATDITEIVLIGDEDEVKAVEVGGGDLSGSSGDGIAPISQCLAHAWIGWVTRMVADGAGGIDFDAVSQAGEPDKFAEDDFSSGRAADISHADEEDAEWIVVSGHACGSVFACFGCGGKRQW